MIEKTLLVSLFNHKNLFMKQQFSKWFTATIKTKSLLVTAGLLLTTAVVIQGCKKNDLNLTGGLSKETFTKEAAKEWYYGVFKKSAEYLSFDQKSKGKKLPKWSESFYKKIGNIEVIEMPLVKLQKDILIPVNDKITRQQQQRIIQASLTKILFLKKGDDIFVRELIYVPDYDYLNEMNFDISNNNFYNLDKKFRGNINIQSWNDEFLNGYKMINGKISKRISIEKKNKNDLSRIRTWTTTQQQVSNGCLREKTIEWKETCNPITIHGMNGGDDLTTEQCEEEIVSESEWEIVYCDPALGECEDPALSFEECLCKQMGGSFCDNENPEPDPEPNPDPNQCSELAETLDAEMNSMNSVSKLDHINDVSETSSVLGSKKVYTKVIELKWTCLESNRIVMTSTESATKTMEVSISGNTTLKPWSWQSMNHKAHDAKFTFYKDVFSVTNFVLNPHFFDTYTRIGAIPITLENDKAYAEISFDAKGLVKTDGTNCDIPEKSKSFNNLISPIIKAN